MSITLFFILLYYASSIWILSILKINKPGLITIFEKFIILSTIGLTYALVVFNVHYNDYFEWLLQFNYTNFQIRFSIEYILTFFCNQFFLNQPWIIFGGLCFFMSTFVSLSHLHYLGLYGVFISNLVTLVIMWINFGWAFYLILTSNSYYLIELGDWMVLNQNFKISFSLFVDLVSISFSFLTISIALFVYVFAFSYFRYEPLVERLLLLLNLFVLSMVLLVSSGNLIVMFLGWEMIGMTSFFLINFWSSKIGTLKSAFKAYTFNKASDVFIFIFIILIFNTCFSLDIPVILTSIHYFVQYSLNCGYLSLPLIDILAISLLLAAFIKSAQFGFHIWLPDSMEAPVPASALIHSATLVSAGIFLLLRFTPIFQLSLYSIYAILFIGSFTAFYGGWVSMFQSDLKKILAYSTISHCGFLMVVYTTFITEYTILYLYIHGFFKAIIFLSVGNILRFNQNYQDFRRMGQYYKYLPFDSIICFLCLINLSGLPFTYGYFIKHFLFVGLSVPFLFKSIIWCLLVTGAVSGLFYSFRLYYYTFFDIKKNKKIHYLQCNRSVLKSRHYSNSSVGGNLAITGLFILAYVVSIFIFLYLSNINFVNNLTDGVVTINFTNLIYENSTNLTNNIIVGTLVLFLIIVLTYSNWRLHPYYWYTFSQFLLVSSLLIIFINI